TVNLFVPSTLNWAQRGVTVTQSTNYPAGDTTTLTLSGSMSGSWSIRVRIPAWTQNPVLSVNGVAQNVTATPGSYATITRTWATGDTLTVKLPMRVIMQAANDNPGVQAITYGPAVLCGNYGNTTLNALPSLDVASITRTNSSSLAFTATANGSAVTLGPFHDAHGYNYTVYWNTGGGTGASVKLVNAGTGLVLGVKDMSTADGGLAVVWGDTGTADHQWVRVTDGSAVRFRNVNSGKVLGVENMSTADNARVLQWSDNGTADHRWTLVDNGNGTYRIRNVNSGKVLAILNGSSTWGTQVVQDSDNGSADNNWRLV
ncbi:MAG: RICIN domain-containing protein, partial [Actinomycetota bacterium]|nr:RICIN domain-containing protein [Actinomycetota bacterium]